MNASKAKLRGYSLRRKKFLPICSAPSVTRCFNNLKGYAAGIHIASLALLFGADIIRSAPTAKSISAVASCRRI